MRSERFRFEPKKDITAYELARIVRFLQFIKYSSEAVWRNEWDGMDKKTKRHITHFFLAEPDKKGIFERIFRR